GGAMPGHFGDDDTLDEDGDGGDEGHPRNAEAGAAQDDDDGGEEDGGDVGDGLDDEEESSEGEEEVAQVRLITASVASPL
ncbi:hypothetical protein, partial [Escherichia coli]|uniref:hypothetical protein n=1 Tax=Escherichia coli TaxID=562 RepID=UPI003078CAF4